jgi:hypothetical protein
MERHGNPIREKCGLVFGRCSYQVYLFMGFNLVTTLSNTFQIQHPDGRWTVIRRGRMRLTLPLLRDAQGVKKPLTAEMSGFSDNRS